MRLRWSNERKLLLSILAVIAGLALHQVWSNRVAHERRRTTAEPRNSLAEIGKDVLVAYDRTARVGGSGRLCTSASRPVRASSAAVSGKKYRSTPADWEGDAAENAGFACLTFSLDRPQYYQYSYVMTGSGSEPGDSFEATARGDLNGDGIYSTFTLRGRINAERRIVVDATIDEENSAE